MDSEPRRRLDSAQEQGTSAHQGQGGLMECWWFSVVKLGRRVGRWILGLMNGGRGGTRGSATDLVCSYRQAFEEALKIWTEKQKMERTPPREPSLSESELATLMTFTDASRDLFEKVTEDLELSPPAQALKFIDNFAMKTSTVSTDGKVPPRVRLRW